MFYNFTTNTGHKIKLNVGRKGGNIIATCVKDSFISAFDRYTLIDLIVKNFE